MKQKFDVSQVLEILSAERIATVTEITEKLSIAESEFDRANEVRMHLFQRLQTAEEICRKLSHQVSRLRAALDTQEDLIEAELLRSGKFLKRSDGSITVRRVPLTDLEKAQAKAIRALEALGISNEIANQIVKG